MEYEKIKQLMIDMGNSKLTSIDIEFPDGVKIKMEKNVCRNLGIHSKTSGVRFETQFQTNFPCYQLKPNN